MTRALDTNIAVRLLADPLSPQHQIAERQFQTPFLLTMSVVLETEWVLRSFYRWRRDQIADGLTYLLEMPTLATAPPALDWVIDRYRNGADFADMMHLVGAEGASSFVTFDADLARCAQGSPIPIETLR